MTNTVSYPTGMAANADGLVVKYGSAEAQKAVAGSPLNSGDNITQYWEIDWTRLPAFSANEATGQLYGGYPNQCIPLGAFIQSISFIPTTAFTGTGATLSIGLVSADGLTEIDNDGLIDAVALTSIDTIGETFTTGGALVGNNNGAILSANGYLWVSVQVATYTAGHARFGVTYSFPRSVA